MIGDDSGGRGIFLDLSRPGQAPVYLQGHGAIGDDAYEVLAPSLSDWLMGGGQIP